MPPLGSIEISWLGTRRLLCAGGYNPRPSTLHHKHAHAGTPTAHHTPAHLHPRHRAHHALGDGDAPTLCKCAKLAT